MRKVKGRKLTLIGGVRFKHKSCSGAERLNPAPNKFFGDYFMAKTMISELYDSPNHGEVTGMKDWFVFAPIFDDRKQHLLLSRSVLWEKDDEPLLACAFPAGSDAIVDILFTVAKAEAICLDGRSGS